ncbi:MAG: hypothetical protein ABIE74_00915 [Pseudomonadota bacterium]
MSRLQNKSASSINRSIDVSSIFARLKSVSKNGAKSGKILSYRYVSNSKQHIFTIQQKRGFLSKLKFWGSRSPKIGDRIEIDHSLRSLHYYISGKKMIYRYGDICQAAGLSGVHRIRRNERGFYFKRNLIRTRTDKDGTVRLCATSNGIVSLLNSRLPSKIKPYCRPITRRYGSYQNYCSKNRIGFITKNGCHPSVLAFYTLLKDASKKSSSVKISKQQKHLYNWSCSYIFKVKVSRAGCGGVKTYFVELNDEMNRAVIYTKNTKGKKMLISYGKGDHSNSVRQVSTDYLKRTSLYQHLQKVVSSQ